VRKLSAAGLRVAVNLAPIMPLINDTEPSLDAVAKAAARAGAEHLGGKCGLLKPCAQKSSSRFSRNIFPTYLRRYRNASSQRYLRGDYPT